MTNAYTLKRSDDETSIVICDSNGTAVAWLPDGSDDILVDIYADTQSLFALGATNESIKAGVVSQLAAAGLDVATIRMVDAMPCDR